jgi:hypothetical protein
MKLEDGRRQWAKHKSTSIDDTSKVFATLFRCWCHNPVATFSLCLLAQAYDLSFALVKRFSQMDDVSVGFLMQIDKLVYLLESPIFVHLRLKLLDVESKSHAPLLKSIYGILLCLPQGDAFRLLNNRLTTVCNLRDNLGLSPIHSLPDDEVSTARSKKPLSMEKLLLRYDHVLELHLEANEIANNLAFQEEQELLVEAGTLSSPSGRIADAQIPASSSGQGRASGHQAGISRNYSESSSPHRQGQQFEYRVV